jgi:S-DNA-T family DNA segregation ATPase FtsK/SpoIIIE
MVERLQHTLTPPPAMWIGLGLTVAVIITVIAVMNHYAVRTNFCISDWEDPLRAPIGPLGDTDDPQFVPVAMDQDGRTVHLPLIDTHLLVAGATGSGKGSVLWSLVCGIQPMADAGLCKLFGIDAKGGMELRMGEELFDVVVDNPADAASLLEEAARNMNRRTTRLARRRIRLAEPTADEPLIVIVIDELADLLDGPDKALNARIADAIRSLLRKGRAPLVCLVGCTQDARKAVIPDRDLWPTRVALRTTEAQQAALILGTDAVEQGALTHRIPRRSPGIGFIVEGGGLPRRIRFSHMTDDYIRDTVEHWTGELDDEEMQPA